MGDLGITLESLAQFGAGAGIVTAAIAVTRWYARLAEVGESTWTKRLDAMEDDYEKDRERWNAARNRHDSEVEALRTRHDSEIGELRTQLKSCVEARATVSAEMADLRREVRQLRDDRPFG